MLRWCLSTVRAHGGHDTNSRLYRFFGSQALRLSRTRFTRANADATAAVVDLVDKQDVSVVTSLTGPQDASFLRPSTDSLGDRDAHRAARSRTSHSAIDTLRRFLSSENVAADHPLVYSPTTIRSLYYRIESRDQLAMLDSRMLTLLIGLFGSLSTSPRISAVYGHPLASRLFRVSTARTHWSFVLKVGRYKSERGMPLQDSDRFWLMRAELATAQTRSSLIPLSHDAYSAVLRARTHYHIIRRHSRHPELHADYLETLLAFRDTRLLDFAVSDLSLLLRSHPVCHLRLQRLLHHLVIKYGGSLSTRAQEAILAALWSRVCQKTGETFNPVPENGLSHVTSILNTTTIASSLSTALFGFVDDLPNDKSVISLGNLFSVFSPTHALPLRWSSLVLFSIFNTSETLEFNRAHLAGDYGVPQVVSCWRVIFGLAIVEQAVLQQTRSDLVMEALHTEEVNETTRKLYQLWLPVIKSRLVSQDLACAVCTSFLRIASVQADAALFYDFRDLYRAENSSEVPRTSMQKQLATRYAAAAVRVQGLLPKGVLTVLEGFPLDLEQVHQILAFAVEALIPTDVALAYTLYTVVQGKGIEFDPGVIYGLAASFAQRGAYREAIFVLNDCQCSLEKRGVLISTIARSLRENSRIRHIPSALGTIVNELAALYRSHVPPDHFRGHLEQLFVALAQHGRGSQLLPVILAILKRSSRLLQPRFFVRYCHALIRHRQFSATRKLLDAISPVHPGTSRSLGFLTGRIMMRIKVFQVFKRTVPLRGPTSLKLSSRLRRPFAGLPLGPSLQELLKSGRVHAAKCIFACAAATISPSPRQCTVLGNIMLHGVSHQPTSRNGRCVRKVLALLEELVQNHGFRPDRVTTNILVKAMINWRSAFDSLRLRELYDQLVKGGYPAGDYSSLRPPFNTRQSHFSDSSGLSKLPPFISFEKHTRPLFKMFIKAFYLCNDVEAARKVVGILKVEEHKNAVAKEVRQTARSRGKVKASQKNVTPLDATVILN